MGKFRDFVEQINMIEGLWLNDERAEIGKSRIYPPKKVKTQATKIKAPTKFRIPPPIQINLDGKSVK